MAEALSGNNQVAHAVVCTVGTIPYMSSHKVQVPAKITHKIKANDSVYEQSSFTQSIKKERHELL